MFIGAMIGFSIWLFLASYNLDQVRQGKVHMPMLIVGIIWWPGMGFAIGFWWQYASMLWRFGHG